ncbi:hypothetical protein EW145_g924 [Phellinidium pouzarii]|uniref:Methylosome subunit pICln n=1 Tax=Phellinidium pouzarii TaxID=167371 RepID=A0A4S4LLX1_9AGAM|nr:hypothetical protein EW145_g924 [Phellinidium pouzarii]
MPVVATISAIPICISPNEHSERTAATPASFADIPPVLRLKEQNVQMLFDPPVADLSEEELKNGSIYIIESVLAFISASSGRGFQIEYPRITLHAISRADSEKCIYCQLDESPQNGTEDVQDDLSTEMRELKIIPENTSSLDALFDALSLCASLHPDPTSISDDDLDNDAFIDADGSDAEPELSEVGRTTLEHLESILQESHGMATEVNGVNGHDEDLDEGSDGDDERFADAEGPPNV